MTISYQTCGKCLQPIAEGETGLRHFGSYMAHPEDRCIYLLIRKLIDREPAIKKLQDANVELRSKLQDISALVDSAIQQDFLNRAGILTMERIRAVVAEVKNG